MFIPTQSFLLTPSLEIVSSNQSSDVQIIQASSRNSTAKRDVKIQKYLRQKEVVQTIQIFKAQNKRAEKKAGANHWEPRLKIGVTLLVIGIVLSVFGLGLIGGISAFIGLLFTILGLLNTYY
jgi:Flp pilus assembly protein TadB